MVSFFCQWASVFRKNPDLIVAVGDSVGVGVGVGVGGIGCNAKDTHGSRTVGK